MIDDGTPPRPATLRHVGLALLLVIGAWPFYTYLTSVPLQPDSIIWLQRSHPSAEGWSEWVFDTSHFVGYRPLTALSFAGDFALFGTSIFALRLTDLLLHLAAGFLVALLARRLAGTGAALVAALVFIVHPGADEVVPFLARRSYSLATVGALAGLLLATRAVSGGRVAFALVGPALLLGMAGNELGALLALALPVVALASADRERRTRALAVTAWGWAWIGLGVLLRERVMEGGGGYPTDGTWLDRSVQVVTLYGAALVGRLQGPGGVWTALVMVAVAYLAVASVLAARGDDRTFLPLGFLGVLALYGGIVASQAVWFPRQVYPAAALASVLIAVLASRALDAPGGATRAFHGVGLVVLAALLLHDSQAIVGPSPGRVRKAEVATAFVDDVRASIDDLELPARLYVVGPTTSETPFDRAALRADWNKAANRRADARIRVPFRWLKLVEQDREVTLGELAYVADVEQYDRPRVEASPLRVELPAGARCYDASGRRLIEMPEDRRAVLGHAIAGQGPPAFIWIYGLEGAAGSFTPVDGR